MATDNFVEDVHGGFQCEVQKPYVLYRNRANEVRGAMCCLCPGCGVLGCGLAVLLCVNCCALCAPLQEQATPSLPLISLTRQVDRRQISKSAVRVWELLWLQLRLLFSSIAPIPSQPSPQVVGIWFYDDADCDRISALLQRIASTFAAPAEAGAGASVSCNGLGGKWLAWRAACCKHSFALPCATLQETLLAFYPARNHTTCPLRVPQKRCLQTLLTPAADDSAVHSGSDADMGRVHGDNGFWDRQVEVPDEVQAPDSQPVANGQPALQAPEQVMAAAVLVPAPCGGGNDLARLFAGMKMGGAPAAAASAPSAQPPAPAAAPSAAAQPMQLLTPQLLQQEAASAVPPAVQARPAPAADVPAPAAGSELLQSLLRGSTAAAPPTAPPAPHSVDITGKCKRRTPWICEGSRRRCCCACCCHEIHANILPLIGDGCRGWTPRVPAKTLATYQPAPLALLVCLQRRRIVRCVAKLPACCRHWPAMTRSAASWLLNSSAQG